MSGSQADAPAVRTRDVVQVTGPWLAGTTSVVTALRERMPGHVFVEDLAPGDALTAVVFVVSAAAVLTESDCALLDSAAGGTDLVVGVVSKTDAYRDWRESLAADCALLSRRARRYAHLPWVGAAAAPDLGEPRLDELVGVLRRRLAAPDLARRNRLRARELHIQTLIDRCHGDDAAADRRARVVTLHKTRDDISRGRRIARSERAVALRAEIQQARVRLGYLARNRCASMRAELAEDVSGLGRGRRRGFETRVRQRVASVAEEVDDGITEELADAVSRLGLPAAPIPTPLTPPETSAPPLPSRRLENQLTVVLGAGFGLGVGVVVTRLVTGLIPGMEVGGPLAGVLAGLVLTLWVVGIRGLLHDRALLDRWVADAANTLRAVLEERVASRVLVAERMWTSAAAARDEHESAASEERLAEIDAELREHAAQTARAAGMRDRRLQSLHRSLHTVQARIDRAGPEE